VAQAHDWQGFYVGINGGFADTTFDTSRDVTTNGGYVAQDVLDIEAISAISLSQSEFSGGIQAGFNWVGSGMVFGVEGDFNMANSSESASVTGNWTIFYGGANAHTTTVETNLEWLATLRARLGMSAGGNLLYVTGGAAFAEADFTQGFSETTFPVPFSSVTATETLTGWTAGAGVEIPLGTNLSLKAEYLYVDLGSIDTVGSVGVGSSYNGTADITANVYRVGINLKL
jgi:outer membrane immunogenic protein